jgi:hypothetical protein
LIDLKDGQREIRIFQCTLNPWKEFAS